MMDYYSAEEDYLLFEADGPKQTKSFYQDVDFCSPDKGIQLQISHQSYDKSFKKFVSVIVAVEKLKKTLVPCPQDFQDIDLSILFSLIFDEKPISSGEWDDLLECDAHVKSINCKLEDSEEKSLVLSDPQVLKAIHLQKHNQHQEVVITMSIVQGDENSEKTPVVLSLKGKNLYLSCIMQDNKPTLQLEKLDPKHYPRKKMEKRFVFNRTEIGTKLEFESALFPTWYISTTRAENMPVYLGKNDGSQDLTDFTKLPA